MIFSNKENERVELADGRTIWLSRSPAVVMSLLAIEAVGTELVDVRALFGKRGPTCPDEVGKWSLPCGYMDWDESGTDAAKRETWEETGVVIDNIDPLVECMEQPWFVRHDPNSNKQNISLHFGMAFKVESPDQLPETSTKNCEEGEVDELKWISILDTEDAERSYAFNHFRTVSNFWKEVSTNVITGLEIKDFTKYY